MPALIVLIVIGFLAQLVDGALGMAYGATSSTLLLAYGLSPATASASVHLAELGTTKLGTVDLRLGYGVEIAVERRGSQPRRTHVFLGQGGEGKRVGQEKVVGLVAVLKHQRRVAKVLT